WSWCPRLFLSATRGPRKILVYCALGNLGNVSPNCGRTDGHPANPFCRHRRDLGAMAHQGVVHDLLFRALRGGLPNMCEVARRIDERKMGKSLREITDQPARTRLVLFTQQTHVIAQ